MKLVTFILGTVVIICGIVVFLKGRPIAQNEQQQQMQNEQNPVFSTRSSSVQSTSTPLPQETDIIRTFFQLISEKKISEAVSMMSDSITQDDSQKQAWGVQFNAFQSINILGVEPSMKEEWSDIRHSYKVTLDVTMNPDSSTAPIPYYGYEKGTNIRWITLEKSGNKWNIAEIATGP